jgi:1,4-dihydroxy-2-naphthoate octaprenyltransferase
VNGSAPATIPAAAGAAAAAPAPAPGSIGAWLLATRPKTLSAAVVPVAVGTAVAAASGNLHVLAALAALAGAVGIQIGTNLANDVFDFEKGADTEARIGPLRVTQAGLLTPTQVRAGMIAAFAFATLAGVYLVAVAGWPIVAIGIASVASGLAYTGGPWPLGYHGLGDLFVFVFFGLVAVMGTAFVQTGLVTPVALLAAIPVGAISTAVLVVNNVRDEPTDRVAGKRTLAVRFGRRAGIAEYGVLLVIAYLIPVVVAVVASRPFAVAPLITAPEAMRLARVVARETAGVPLNAALAGTARLLALFGILFALGIVL